MFNQCRSLCKTLMLGVWTDSLSEISETVYRECPCSNGVVGYIRERKVKSWSPKGAKERPLPRNVPHLHLPIHARKAKSPIAAFFLLHHTTYKKLPQRKISQLITFPQSHKLHLERKPFGTENQQSWLVNSSSEETSRCEFVIPRSFSFCWVWRLWDRKSVEFGGIWVH